MKKFILLFASVFMMIMSAASSLESLGLGVAQGLVPLLEPIVQETVVDGIKHLKAVATGKSCLLGCREVGAPYCMSEFARSKCKGGCQSIYQVGGYELRIRFKLKKDGGEDWSLAACVRHGVSDGKQTSAGKGNTKSIAIYSQKDYESVLRLISMKMAARGVVDSKGSKLKEEELKKKGLTREEAVKEAGELETHIRDAIEKNVKEGLYGNQ